MVEFTGIVFWYRRDLALFCFCHSSFDYWLNPQIYCKSNQIFYFFTLTNGVSRYNNNFVSKKLSVESGKNSLPPGKTIPAGCTVLMVSPESIHAVTSYILNRLSLGNYLYIYIHIYACTNIEKRSRIWKRSRRCLWEDLERGKKGEIMWLYLISKIKKFKPKKNKNKLEIKKLFVIKPLL